MRGVYFAAAMPPPHALSRSVVTRERSPSPQRLRLFTDSSVYDACRRRNADARRTIMFDATRRVITYA